MTLTEKLRRFKALQDKATPGPWDHNGHGRICHGDDMDSFGVVVDTAYNKATRTDENLRNADLIAAARDFPAGDILARLEELEAAVSHEEILDLS